MAAQRWMLQCVQNTELSERPGALIQTRRIVHSCVAILFRVYLGRGMSHRVALLISSGIIVWEFAFSIELLK